MKEKIIYICSSCGYTSPKWLGKCPSCGEWNSFNENLKEASKTSLKHIPGSIKVHKLKDIKKQDSERILTKINEFNRITGGGLIKDSVTILTSPPGGGKSTLALAVANDIASQGYSVLYASGEESYTQIKNRADRILENISEKLWIISSNSMDDVLDSVQETAPDLIIVDSIQTFALNEFLPARAGNPVQTMGCAGELVKLAKHEDKKRAVIIIGQMNKNDELAGLRTLEHLVDTVLIIDSENEEELRGITATKNRFGSTGEIGFFAMTEHGLKSIDNPSEFFVTNRENSKNGIAGSAITVIREGTRPIIAEIESLVSASFTPYPSRISDTMKREQLNTLVSVMEERCGINLFDKNVVIKSTGGIKLKEPSVSLAVIMSIASSYYNIAIPDDCIFIGDVGLTGELKKVPLMESRLKELKRREYKKVFVAKQALSSLKKDENYEIIGLNTLKEVIQYFFSVRKP